MISPPTIPVLIEQYIPGKYATSLKYLQLHISLIVIGREREGMMLLCLMQKIPQILREEKAEHHCCLREQSTNTTYERLERIIRRNLWVLFWKPCKTLE
jgi:hypothetical protein